MIFCVDYKRAKKFSQEMGTRSTEERDEFLCILRKVSADEIPYEEACAMLRKARRKRQKEKVFNLCREAQSLFRQS